MERVPIQSFYKNTLANIFDNEGEVNYTVQIINAKIKANHVLAEMLENSGYVKTAHSFTPEQVALIFKHLHHPILNNKNRKLLNLKNRASKNSFLFTIHKLLPTNNNANLKKLHQLSDAAINSLGLAKHPKFNFYTIENIENHCIFNKHKHVELCGLPDFNIIKKIHTTQELIEELVKLKNE